MKKGKKYTTHNKSIIKVIKKPGQNRPGIAKVLQGGNNYLGYLTVKKNSYFIINHFGDAISVLSETPVPSNVGESDFASFKGLCFDP